MKKMLAGLGVVALASLSCAQEKDGVKEAGVAPVTTAGKVHWHRSLEEARAAAAVSKKPVLHFQLLGHLDQEFC